jgi:hypothetical protein
MVRAMRARPHSSALFAGVACVALLDACAGSGPGPVSPVLAAEEDFSSPLTDSDAPFTLDTSSMKRPLRGAIASIAAVPDSKGWFDIQIVGDDAPDTRTLRIGTKARLPFTAGDVLDVRWQKHMVGWNAWDIDLELRDATGGLWAALYTTLDEHEGWTFEILPAGDGAPCRIALTHQGRRAVIPTGAWRKLETQDGTWGAAVDCPEEMHRDPKDPLIPDYSPNPTVVEVSRLGGP